MSAAGSFSIPCGGCGASLRPGSRGTTRCVCGVVQDVFPFRPFRRPPRPSLVVLQPGTPCAFHSGNLAVQACERCGSFVCELCATEVGGSTYCTQCFERVRREGSKTVLKSRFSRPHAAALLLAFVGLIPPFSLLMVPLAAWQGVSALRRGKEIGEREPAFVVHVAVAALLCVGGLVLTVAAFRGGGFR